jgi:hypothetical protein
MPRYASAVYAARAMLIRAEIAMHANVADKRRRRCR